jgi:hypothetical protein
MSLFQNTTLAESSRKLYDAKLAQFISFMPQGTRSIESIVDNPDKAVAALANQTNGIAQTNANKHMYYSAVVAFLKHTDDGKRRSQRIKDKWTEIQKTNWEQRRSISLNNSPLEAHAEVANTVDWAKVQEKRDSLPSGSLERLLLSLYTFLPPVRADYYEMRINPPKSITEAQKTNFMLLTTNPSTSFIIIRDFKTASKYNEIKHALPPKLHEQIIASLTLKPRSYIFTMPSDNSRPFDRNGFSKWANAKLTELFQVPMTLTTLRHLYISTIDFNKTRASELEKIGNAMGHSISMQKGYQWIKDV